MGAGDPIGAPIGASQVVLVVKKVKVAQLCPTLCDLMDYTVHGILQAKILDWVAFLQGIFPTQGSNPGLAMREVSLPAEPPGKPKNTGVGSLPLLQQIFPTQELNWGLLHCRLILYQLSYQGVVKNPPANAGDVRDAGSIYPWVFPESERSPGGGHGNLLQCSCLENPMDRGAWRAMVHRVTKSQIQLKRLSKAQHNLV